MKEFGRIRPTEPEENVVPAHEFDDEEIRLLLIGTEEEIGRGLGLIDCHLRHGLCGWLRKQFPGIRPQDLADLWGETLLGVLKAVREGRFDGNRPLLPWLCQIARARAIDHLRRRTTQEQALAAVGETLKGTRTGQAWGDWSAVERREALALIQDAIATLSGRQRLVMQVFVDCYPASARMETLRQEVSRATGQVQTLASVKRALQEARAKARELLQHKGYDFGKRGNP